MDTLIRHELQSDNIPPAIDMYQFFMQLPAAIIIVKGENYTIEFVNDFYLQLLHQQKKIIGTSIFSAFPELHILDTQRLLNKVLKNGQPIHIEKNEINISSGNKTEQRFFRY